jgi:hypothetical protein
MNRAKLALKNMESLRHNAYPGRGVFVGRDVSGRHIVQATWIMGRSEKSRNRIYRAIDGRVFTEAADPEKMKGEDTGLIIYNAMDENGVTFVASNGHQTDSVIMSPSSCDLMNLDAVLSGYKYEPDAPNFTPRITTTCYIANGKPQVQFSVLRKSSSDSSCERDLFKYGRHSMIDAGYGYYVSTYTGDGNPLPPWQGEPSLLPVMGYPDDSITDYLWTLLNPENRVSLAVKFIDLGTQKSRVTIVNKNKRTE